MFRNSSETISALATANISSLTEQLNNSCHLHIQREVIRGGLHIVELIKTQKGEKSVVQL